MPVIRVTDPQGEMVYEGEGEIVQHGHDLALVQNRRMENGDILSRRVELSRVMETVPFQVSRSVRPSQLRFRNNTEGWPCVEVDPSEPEWNISFGAGAEGFAQYLAHMLSAPVETAEERRHLGEMRAQAYRTLDPDCISEALEAGAIDESTAAQLRTFGAFREYGGLLASGREQLYLSASRAQEALEQLTAALADPGVDLDANEELIRSTRSEFPYDPHGYDHPRTNEMSWSPPPEGEEVPSCPA